MNRKIVSSYLLTYLHHCIKYLLKSVIIIIEFFRLNELNTLNQLKNDDLAIVKIRPNLVSLPIEGDCGCVDEL